MVESLKLQQGYFLMSHLTDEARAAYRDAQPTIDMGNQSLEAIVAANPARRTVLKNGLMGLSILPMLGSLAACGEFGLAACGDLRVTCRCARTSGGTSRRGRLR